MAKQQRPLPTPTRMTPEDVANHLAALQAKQVATPLLPSNRSPARKWNKAARILILTFLIFCAIIMSAIASLIGVGWYIALIPIIFLILIGFVSIIKRYPLIPTFLIFCAIMVSALASLTLFTGFGVGWYTALIPITFPILVVFVFIVKRYSWAGFQKKTLWDWLEVTLIPILLLIITISATEQQTATMQQQNTIADEQHKSEVLQNYTSTIQNLMLHEGLHQSKPGENVRIIATTQTTLALKQLDGERKGSLLLFIYQLGLINTSKAIIDLGGADSSLTDFNGADLGGADLRFAHLRGADLVGANLFVADLSQATLIRNRAPRSRSQRGQSLCGRSQRGQSQPG